MDIRFSHVSVLRAISFVERSQTESALVECTYKAMVKGSRFSDQSVMQALLGMDHQVSRYFTFHKFLLMLYSNV